MGSAELLLYGGLASAAFAVYSLVSSLIGNNSNKELLSWATGQEPAKSRSQIINWFRPLVHNFTLQHVPKIKNATRIKKVETLIRTGGLSRELNVDEFIGFQIFLGFALPTLLLIANYALAVEAPLLLLLALYPFGWHFPVMYAKSERTRRESEARRDLPFFVDLIALTTEAGLDFIGAIERIVDKADPKSTLAQEFAIVLKDVRIGASRADALKGLAKRIDCQEIVSLVAVIVDADRMGTSVSKVLKDQSAQVRMERFVRAQKAGARASQLMLFPMMFIIMPAFLIVVIGPVVLNMMYGGN